MLPALLSTDLKDEPGNILGQFAAICLQVLLQVCTIHILHDNALDKNKNRRQNAGVLHTNAV
jgi:hypothetical protein